MRINVLGPLEVSLSDGSAMIKGTKRCALLAALLLQPGRTVSKTRLIDAIWDESPPSSATANIRTYVTDLRKSLGRTRDGRPRLASSSSGYAIEVRQEELDLLCFEKLADEGTAAAKTGDVGRAASCLDGAARLWRGQPFDGIELGSWAQARIAALQERRWDVLSEWVEARLALGQFEDVIFRLRDMLAERPLSERTWVQLMITLDRVGKRSEALAAFAKARTVLADELGIEPGPELSRVHQRIRAGERSPASRPAPAIRMASRPCALPAAVPDFVGRARELRRLRERLSERDDGAMVVAEVSGPPGVGKTALAVQVAHAVRPAFPDGQLYQSLGGSSTRPRPPAAVLAELLRSLGMDQKDIPDGIEDRAALYRSTVADRRLLVVLDDAADVAQIKPLLPGTGACRAIVSSRVRLTALDGAQLISLGPLSGDEAVSLLAGVIGTPRVQPQLAAARRIVLGCAFLPLAVRIVAARLATRPLWPLAALADRLGDDRGRLDELSLGEVSVRACLDSGYRGLSDEARRAARLIAELGRVELPSARFGEVLGRPEPETDRIVEQLVCAHLLVPVRDGVGVYRLDELFRLYVSECLEEVGNG